MKKIISLLFFLFLFMNINHAAPVYIQLDKNWKMWQAEKDSVVYNATVPGCVHTDLLWNNAIEDPFFRMNEKNIQWIDKEDWVYETSFKLDKAIISNSHAEIVFKGLDTYADVYLNDSLILSADNMFREYTVNIKKTIVLGENTLRVHFHSPIKKGLNLLEKNRYTLPASNDQAENGGLEKNQTVSPFIRKAPYHFGWDWGPRFVTSGIWKPMYIQFWNKAKIRDVYVRQLSLDENTAKLHAEIEITPILPKGVTFDVSVNGKSAGKTTPIFNKQKSILIIPFTIHKPNLWWPAGFGQQTLYDVTVSMKSDGKTIEKLSRKIGLRTVELVQKEEKEGQTFYFRVNGTPIFARGANHIPNDMFLNRVSKEVYDDEINTAVLSNMNMLRVWGGGVYEDDYFYELCDSKGIMVWQDFMFACSMYPGDEKFLTSVKHECADQLKRLRNHPSIVLWCGNNEIDIAWQQFNPNGGWGWKQQYNTEQKDEIWKSYVNIFKTILPKQVKKYTYNAPYIHSSPISEKDSIHAKADNKYGDSHYWGVWHERMPFEDYAKNIGRFMSEYGFQSFPEMSTIKTFALPEDHDIESPVMKSHQRSYIGNEAIREYMQMYYRIPKKFEDFIYVSQLLQADAMQQAIEAHRLNKPYNMGSLYWQINDCWPVASWATTDYYKHWKAAQYRIKEAFEPIIPVIVQGDNQIKIAIISDLKKDSIPAKVTLNFCDFMGNVSDSVVSNVNIHAGKANNVLSIPMSRISAMPVNSTFLLLTLKLPDGKEIRKIHTFVKPKNLELKKPALYIKSIPVPDGLILSFSTNGLAKNVYLSFPNDKDGFFSDNYFDVVPNFGKTVKYTFGKEQKFSALELNVTTLFDTLK